MLETKKTMIFVGVAVGLALIAFLSAPSYVTPDAFLDQGEPFFPDFADPNEATTLEVVEYNEQTGEASPFKVTFEAGVWTIPSHNGYPADGKDRLAKTAAGVIGIKKDDFRSNNVADHEACGVVDPLDESAGLAGRGKRVTLKKEDGSVLADFIVGNEVPDREGFRFVRIPDQKRIFSVRMDLDLSTRFVDWIERDLLKTSKDAIRQIVVKDYSINERTRQVDNRDKLILRRTDDGWTTPRMSKSKEVAADKMDQMIATLDTLMIVGVRPKTKGLADALKEGLGEKSVGRAEAQSLQSKGYYFTRDGKLLSNEGEIGVRTEEGIIYTLRFGEVVYGSGLAVTAGTDNESSRKKSDIAENRYLFVTAEFDESTFPEPPRPADTSFMSKPDSLMTDNDKKNKRLQGDYERWQISIANVRRITNDLNARFSHWYYVISSDSYDKLHLNRADLIVAKKDDKS
ncbi:MAG: DUF4340 domain-containing protein [Candidatus Zixiibacteriota bacterium]